MRGDFSVGDPLNSYQLDSSCHRMERLKSRKISIGVQALGLSFLTCKLGIIPRLRAVMSACLKAQLLVRSHQNHSDYVCYFHPASSRASANVGLSWPLPVGSPGETLNSCRKQGIYFSLFTTVPIWGMELGETNPTWQAYWRKALLSGPLFHILYLPKVNKMWSLEYSLSCAGR